MCPFILHYITESIAGPRRILVDSLLTRVKDMSTTEFETDFNVSTDFKIMIAVVISLVKRFCQSRGAH